MSPSTTRVAHTARLLQPLTRHNDTAGPGTTLRHDGGLKWVPGMVTPTGWHPGGTLPASLSASSAKFLNPRYLDLSVIKAWKHGQSSRTRPRPRGAF